MDVTHRVITVVAPSHMLELLVPQNMTPAQLIPELLETIETTADSPERSTAPNHDLVAGRGLNTSTVWSLVRRPGVVLPADEPLDAHDGEEFALVADTGRINPPKIIPALIGPTPDDDGARWSQVDTHLTGWIVMLAGLATTFAVLGSWIAASPLAAFPWTVGSAAGWTTFLWTLSRRSPSNSALITAGWILPTACVATAAFWAESVLALPVQVLPRGDVTATRIAGVCVGVLFAAALLASARPNVLSRGIATAAIATSTVIGSSTLLVSVWARSDIRAAATAAAILAVIVLREAPALAVQLQRRFRPRPTDSTTGDSTGSPSVWHPASREPAAVSALFFLGLGAGAALLWSWAFLIGGNVVEHGVLAATAVIAAARPQALRHRLHKAMTLSIAVSGVAAVVAVTLRGHPAWVAFTVVSALAVLAPPLANTVAGRRPPAMFARLLDAFDAIAVAATVPLLADELGLFRAASTLARRWVG